MSVMQGSNRNGIVAAVLASLILAITASTAANAESEPPNSYSPYVGRELPNRVFFGDTHLHTANSPDAFLFGARIGPEVAYRLAKGEQVESTHGLPLQLVRPLDFLVVSDHLEYLGLMPRLFSGDEMILETDYGRLLYDTANSGDRGFFKAAMILVRDLSMNARKMEVPELESEIWSRVAEAADHHNVPGVFTAFTGYEWTSMIEGNNLHRVVIYEGSAEQTASAVPASSFDSPDPEDLWASLAAYEARTGGQVLAIPHNANLSNGMMFERQRIDGSTFNAEYAAMRARWEPLVEVTQIKGDGEAHPKLSPDDEFADYESWDTANLAGTEAKTDDMLEGEYARSALGLGLQIESDLGVNPYRFGMIGSTDSHTALSTSREDNFFGKHSGLEPNPTRMTDALAKLADATVFGWQQTSSGLAAVWAVENTREALFAAMERKEVYATTGTRIRVRLFAGYDFAQEDLANPEWAARGYALGVPMGGVLGKASRFAKPRLLVRALRDPDGANLDRIQIVKGWINSQGERKEKIYDVALSDGRAVGPDGRAPLVGNTVDLKSATYRNSIGDSMLEAFWEDPDFDRNQRAFYYARVIEIPTPRWTTYDAKAFGARIPGESESITQDRAYTSPIWYSPKGS